MTAGAIPRRRFAVLFAVMLVAAAGNTAMQSLMPAIGRGLGIADIWVAIAFSLSAVIWVVSAPYWARRADRRGRRALMRLGVAGFVISMLICGTVLAAGLAGLIAPMLTFLIFVLGRSFYGAFGSAAPSAVQAYVAARTDGHARTSALAAIASSFGLGTIIGPAVAPLLIFPPLGLSAPLIIFAGIGLAVIAALAIVLPDDTPTREARGRVSAYPSIGAIPGGAAADDEPAGPSPLRWRDPRIFPWHMIGVVGGHGHAALLGVIGFFVIDTVALPLAEAQTYIALTLIAGAGASLVAQWWLIPKLALSPRQLVLWGSVLAGAGALAIGLAGGVWAAAAGFALASFGYGLFRPGFTSGASLAVGPDEQNAAAGMVTSVNGVAFVAAPAAGVAFYTLAMPLPFMLVAALMTGLAGWVTLRFSPSPRAA